MTLKRRNWSVFSWATDKECRNFCLSRFNHEFAHAQHFAEQFPARWGVRYSDKALIAAARRRMWLASKLPFLSYSFLGLDRCWLTLLGFRFARENERMVGRIETTLRVAEKELGLPIASLKDSTIEDVFSLYSETKLVETWDVNPSVHLKVVA